MKLGLRTKGPAVPPALAVGTDGLLVRPNASDDWMVNRTPIFLVLYFTLAEYTS